MDQKTADMLREKYPNHIPLEVASKYLGVSPRQLSRLFQNTGMDYNDKEVYYWNFTNENNVQVF